MLVRKRITVGFLALGLVSLVPILVDAPATADTPCSGVEVTGGDLAAQVNAAPSGTTFCIAAGVYRTGNIAPKDGDRLIGAPGAVLDGGGQFGRAIANTRASTCCGGCAGEAAGVRLSRPASTPLLPQPDLTRASSR